jgi:hypothetical protein
MRAAKAADPGTFISDPLEVARKLYSLSQAQRRLAHQYRHWADQSKTALERHKWAGESIRCWDGAFFHLRKYREYVESAIG